MVNSDKSVDSPSQHVEYAVCKRTLRHTHKHTVVDNTVVGRKQIVEYIARQLLFSVIVKRHSVATVAYTKLDRHGDERHVDNFAPH